MFPQPCVHVLRYMHMSIFKYTPFIQVLDKISSRSFTATLARSHRFCESLTASKKTMP